MVSRMLSDLPEGHHQEDEDLIRDTAGNVYQGLYRYFLRFG